MYQSISKKIAVNLITGALGSGKTTLLRNVLRQKPAEEHWVLLVNEFGAVGIDGAILSENKSIQVEQIPGGCICCTAQGELKETIEALLKTQSIDRLLIEPTGLGEPDSLVDLLQSDLFAGHFDIQSVFAVFDSTDISVKAFNQYTILQNLAHMADIIIFNKQDLAFKGQLDELVAYAEALYPPKQHILITEQAKIDLSLLSKSHSAHNLAGKAKWVLNKLSEQLNHKNTPLHKRSLKTRSSNLPYHPIELPNIAERLYQKELDIHSIGWIFHPNQTFDWTKLQSLFESLNKQTGFLKVKRAKGVFKVGKPWMLFQWVNQNVSREYIAYRRDSRLELLIEAHYEFDFTGFEKKILACMTD
ncbi:MAG: hypothetical protein GXO35_02315 [Gammaproteobacteria bacterium]|nr:hypothetical protein [Gammaproteobacteria bacterium]